MILPIILAGGSGTRLWPLSRQWYPKQFLHLKGEHSLLQRTLMRVSGSQFDKPLIICNETHRFLAAEQIRQMDYVTHPILLEPEPRSTAPAIALAAYYAQSLNQDPYLLVMPADHIIDNQQSFEQAVEEAIQQAEQGRLVTFGIEPTYAETGFGYIHRGKKITSSAFHIDRFVEKPNAQTAEEYVASKQYYWNSGLFLFKASDYLNALTQFQPEMIAACQQAMACAMKDSDFIRADKEAFLVCPSDSIDYAVMEKTDNAVVVSLDAAWSDIGSWQALWDISEKDAQGNVLQGDVIAKDTNHSLVRADSRLVAVVGLDDVIVVETKDAVLVAHQDKVQSVKAVVEQLKAADRSECYSHREVYRPWGMYDSIDQGNRYQVKRITVNPGARLSVQMHFHRAEHWVVVRGTAKVTRGNETFLVTENHSTYIPVGEIHALENPGKVPLELIEVQSGPYLGEDDIVRFNDHYGRVSEKVES
ncbi:mannose-1-phosphate guanylyltransferase/mannose-6-phosphate isomerase [Legionella sp. W05-934-2]|jgi:mannose-1-phosphate guanylyltransferase|uniref:mannose-1-phosphate guanylyltransferase/mannose-6-phosphate isomerase n=1 Tax=Legionella sp. W05-934-2 TaxID=1198649 RepID=UPI003463487C